jgi:glycosyltransferase involved in cell wall biosynthesis
MKTLTIFTPTYNRAYCLHKVYDSLCRQSNKNFCWLIVDDGSTDDTKNLVASWKRENKIELEYLYQENQGMHGAHNTAYATIKTELNVCIDSDDFMPDNAVELIILNYEKIKDNKNIVGLVGLDANSEGEIIGTKIPDGILELTLYDLYNVYNVKGDKKLVYKTDIVKKYPKYPIFKGERFVPLGYLYQLIDQDFKLSTLNEVLCIVEYLDDGSSMNILKQYKLNPKGFSFSRKSRMQLGKGFIEKFKNAIHYVSCEMFNRNLFFIKESPKKGLTILAIPFGILLNIYIRYKVKK